MQLMLLPFSSALFFSSGRGAVLSQTVNSKAPFETSRSARVECSTVLLPVEYHPDVDSRFVIDAGCRLRFLVVLCAGPGGRVELHDQRQQ
jgi:hypothetical protein